jgi:chlorophyll/bacteriochlorophyll a synthase
VHVVATTIAEVQAYRQETLTYVSVSRSGRRWQVWLELLKPVTWFPPMWAVACGVVASGAAIGRVWPRALLAIVLAGPLVCGASQAVNDWFDRDVDALNEPGRPIPSGRIPGRRGLYFAIAWSVIAALASLPLGRLGASATAVALLLAWAYSAPPARLKRNGWWGNAAVGVSYEGLAWITGTAVVAGHSGPSAAFALLYSVGTIGIMILNDFKAIEGDQRMGIRSLPVQLGVDRAAHMACGIIALTQIVVVAVLVARGALVAAVFVALVTGGQAILMRRFVRHPREEALWFSATSVPLFVAGMMACAIALRVPGGAL